MIFGVAWPLPLPKSICARAGKTVTDTIRERLTETEMATAISRKSWPTSKSMISSGMKTITVVKAETRMAPHTWRAP